MHRRTWTALIGATVAMTGPGALPAPASAKEVLEFETGTLNVSVEVADRLYRDGTGRRFSDFTTATSEDPDPEAEALVGPALSIDRRRVATRFAPLRTAGGMACGGDGTGVVYAYGTVHRRVRRAVATTTQGRFELDLVRRPRGWGARPLKVVAGVRDTTAPLRRVSAYDREGRLLAWQSYDFDGCD